jgi:2-polyprenyl-3-methyl-5-hydroxy-6-metoxy-1,4-benzoquinol methylase
MDSPSLIIQNDEHGDIRSSLEYFLKFNAPKGAKILDVGCSYGSLIYNLYRLGYKNVYGIDIKKEFIEKGHDVYREIADRLVCYDGKKIPFENESFDVILMFDVIEHILDLPRFLKEEVARVLKLGGRLIFQTPQKYPNILWQIIRQRSLTQWKHSSHCSLQTSRTLKSLLVASKFTNIKLEKNLIITNHNTRKVRPILGRFTRPMFVSVQYLPLFIYPNIWGSSIRKI